MFRRTGRGWGLPFGSSCALARVGTPRLRVFGSLQVPAQPSLTPAGETALQDGLPQILLSAGPLQRPHPVEKSHRKLQRTCRPLPPAKARAFGLSVWGCLGPRGELGSRMISPGALDFRLRPSVGTWLQPARQEREDHGPSCCQSQRCRRTGPSSVQNGPQEPEEPPRDAPTSARLGEEACRSSPHVRSSSGKRL